jgi:hypothetical protein
MLFAMEPEGETGRRQVGDENGAQVIRLRPLHVLVVSPDRRFRSVMEMLIPRRGCTASGLGSAVDIAATVARERIDVVLADGMGLLRDVARGVAHGDATSPAVGIVLVGDVAEPGLAGPLALAKWGSFDDLFAAIVDADRARARPLAAHKSGGLSVAPAHELG